MSTERLASKYFDLATQYYVLARAGVVAGMLPVPGTLFHHAIELYLKGDLCSLLSPDQLKRQPFGHSLPGLWQKFVSRYPNEPLSTFDTVIDALHDFEDIRYPDSIVTHGMYSTVSFTPFTPTIEPAPGPPGYHIVVADIDRLIRELFRVTHMNPKAFLGLYGPQGKSALLHLNSTFDSSHLG